MTTQKFNYSIVKPGTQPYLDYLALRHKVFCEELKRVPSTNQFFSNVPLETDSYDEHSIHVLCRDVETGDAVGCTRLILPSTKGLSITGRYEMNHDTADFSNQTGEIGRLAIASELRRHRGELSSAGLHQSPQPKPAKDMEKQHGQIVALGLYREIFKIAHQYGIDHCFAAMEPSLARLLTRIGFPFNVAGPLNSEVQPPRQPYFISAHAIVSSLSIRDSSLYRFMFGANDALALNHFQAAATRTHSTALNFQLAA